MQALPRPAVAPAQPSPVDSFTPSAATADQVGPAEPEFSPSAWPNRKIWLVHGSYTGGHASAARALEKALEAYPGVEAEVINLSDYSKSPVPASTAAETALKGGSWVREARAWFFEQNFESNPVTYWVNNQAMKVEGWFLGDFLDRYEQEKPDLIVSTMSATNSLLSHWKEQDVIDVPLHSVVTDFAVHRIWAQDHVDQYYTASQPARDDLVRFGVDGARTEVTGIPIDPAFSGPRVPKEEARRKLGLDPNLPVLLLMGGSLGYARFAEVVTALDRLAEDFQAVVITGRNQEAKQELEAMNFNHPVRVEGYVTNMPDYVEAADLVLSKPGGLTTSEVLARGKPMLLSDPLAGLESRMVGKVVQTGAAAATSGPPDLARKVQELLSNPAAYAQMEAAALAVGHPNSADEVAQRILASIP